MRVLLAQNAEKGAVGRGLDVVGHALDADFDELEEAGDVAGDLGAAGHVKV